MFFFNFLFSSIYGLTLSVPRSPPSTPDPVGRPVPAAAPLSARRCPPIRTYVQPTGVDKILALGECPPKDLKIGEEWGPEVLNLRLFFLFF